MSLTLTSYFQLKYDLNTSLTSRDPTHGQHEPGPALPQSFWLNTILQFEEEENLGWNNIPQVEEVKERLIRISQAGDRLVRI